MDRQAGRETVATVTPTPKEILGFLRPKVREMRCKDIAIDHLRGMLFKENENYAVSQDYLNFALNGADSSGRNDRANEGWRRKLCEWIFEVVDHFNFDREVVSVALYYLDRVALLTCKSTGKPIPKREFQLIAVASLYIAIKLHGETDEPEGPRKKLKITAFQELSRGYFKVEIIEAKERQMLQILQWRLNPPTSAQFAAQMMRLLPEWSSYDCTGTHAVVASRIFEVAKYLTELSVCVSAVVFRFKSSIISFAAILCAIDSIKINDSLPLPYDVRVQFLKNIAGATGLVPGIQEVTNAQTMLRNVCPALFERERMQDAEGLPAADLLEAASSQLSKDDSGKVSPVSVFENDEETSVGETSQRKRIRTCSHDCCSKKMPGKQS